MTALDLTTTEDPDPPRVARLGDVRVLVLDAAFRPIAAIGWQRAVTLLLAGSAEAIVDTDRIVSSPSVAIVVPSVVRLTGRALVVGRRRGMLARKRSVHERDRWTCAYCGRRARTSLERDEMTVDHVVPRSRGGSTSDFGNLVTACRPCNGRKADRTPDEAGMRLRVTPRPPTWAEQTRWALTGGPGRPVPVDWRPFLGALAA
jgi:5-methylcytosine-specific restriction endonuclease McrA